MEMKSLHRQVHHHSNPHSNHHSHLDAPIDSSPSPTREWTEVERCKCIWFSSLSLVCLLLVGGLVGLILGSVEPHSKRYYDSLIQTTFNVTGLEEKPYRCCSRDCSGTRCKQYYGGTSCSKRIRDKVEGTCGDGYYCCVYKKSQCISSVSNRECYVRCGVCYNPTIYLEYLTYLETVERVSETTGCSTSSCVDEFFRGLRVGGTVEGFYSKHDFKDFQIGTTKEPYPWSPGEIAGVVLFSIGLAFVLLLCCIVAVSSV
jgi:hypothetical protein